MTQTAAQKIVIIGCGNVAWHLAKRLHQTDLFSVRVYNHRKNSALQEFASEFKCNTEVGLNRITRDAAFYFICVSDKFISKVSKKIFCENPAALILHTSGSSHISDIINGHPNKAVFYPLQTFSKQDQLNWEEIPLMLEAANDLSRQALEILAKQFSQKMLFLQHEERLKFHLAAVMVNNFTNALFVASSGLVAGKENDNFRLLLPLIRQTVTKLEMLQPLEAQTGPAKRKDLVVMKKHLALITSDKELRKIYKIMSDLIIKQQSHA